jgi:hypothetical protein
MGVALLNMDASSASFLIFYYNSASAGCLSIVCTPSVSIALACD